MNECTASFTTSKSIDPFDLLILRTHAFNLHWEKRYFDSAKAYAKLYVLGACQKTDSIKFMQSAHACFFGPGNPKNFESDELDAIFLTCFKVMQIFFIGQSDYIDSKRLFLLIKPLRIVNLTLSIHEYDHKSVMFLSLWNTTSSNLKSFPTEVIQLIVLQCIKVRVNLTKEIYYLENLTADSV